LGERSILGATIHTGDQNRRKRIAVPRVSC
jgi:hypothetical protein